MNTLHKRHYKKYIKNRKKSCFNFQMTQTLLHSSFIYFLKHFAIQEERSGWRGMGGEE